MELLIKTENKLSEEIFADMKKQFPQQELKNFTELNQLLSDEKQYKFAIFYDEKTPVGYVFYLENDYLWIDYIAVFQKFHSKGYGSKILDSLFKKYSNLKGCFFEVEPEDSTNILTIKRMKFYKNLGCEILDFKYYFPNDIKELKLELLYKSFDGKMPSKKEILNEITLVFETLHSNVTSKDSTFKMIKTLNIF